MICGYDPRRSVRSRKKSATATSGIRSQGQTAASRSPGAPLRSALGASRGILTSARVGPGELRLAYGIGAHVEGNEGGGRVSRQFELRHLQSVQTEVIVMQLSRRWAGAPIGVRAIVGAPLQGARGQQLRLGIACACRQRTCGGG